MALLTSTAVAQAGVPAAPQPPMILPSDASTSSGSGSTSTANRWILGVEPVPASARIMRGSGASTVSRADGIYTAPRTRARALASQLRRAGILVFAEPDSEVVPTGYPVDLSSGLEWWLNRIVNTIETTPPPVTANSPRLALIEESLDPLHSDLAGLNIKGAKSIGPSEDGHGTAIAAIAGSPVESGSDSSDQNIVGVWPGMNMTLFPSGKTCSTATKAVLDAARSGVAVINMSYGFPSDSCFSHYVATETAVRKGVLPIAAAGNSFGSGGNVPMRPATDPHVLSVSAVDKEGLVASFATRNRKVDITAPGVALSAPVINSIPVGDGLPDIPERTWGEISGTSFSTPMVSAAATWLSQARPDLDARQIFRVLTGSATDLGAPGRDTSYGEGLLNIDAALALKTPPNDPREPNNDIAWVNGGLLKGAAGFLWKPGKKRHRRSVTATLSRYKDPADVYRVRLAPKRKVLITAAQFQGDIKLKVFRPTTKTTTKGKGQIIVRSDQVRPKTEGVRVRNLKRRSQIVYVAITPSPRQASDYMHYRLTVAGR